MSYRILACVHTDVHEVLVMGYGQFLAYPRNGTLFYIDFNGIEQRVPESDVACESSSFLNYTKDRLSDMRRLV